MPATPADLLAILRRPCRTVLRALWALALALGLAATAARAGEEPAADGLLCRDGIARIERAEGLPAGLLQAVALAESGRFDRGRGAALPWPWTVNAGGEAAYLASKAEAIRHVERLRAQGRSNIDVGCLQINLGWHPTAFPDLEAAFEPETNAAYAAAFLQTLREEGGSWEVAVERYHSRDPDRGQGYRERVWRHWASLSTAPAAGGPPLRLAAARPAAGGGTGPAAAPAAAVAALAVTPVRDAAIERAALQAVNRMAARQSWRWLQLQAPMPSELRPGPPAAVLAALDPSLAEPAAGAVVPTAALRRPLVFAGPGRAKGPAPWVRVQGPLALPPAGPGPPAAPAARIGPRRPAAAS